MKQQERQQKSREKILSAAMKEFAERGYEEVTVDSICQKYEISKGMLYHYYSGKDALFLLCVQHTFQQLEEYLLERMEQLEQKVSKHNNLVERTYALEESVALMDERVRVANHRIADLEGHA